MISGCSFSYSRAHSTKKAVPSPPAQMGTSIRLSSCVGALRAKNSARVKTQKMRRRIDTNPHECTRSQCVCFRLVKILDGIGLCRWLLLRPKCRGGDFGAALDVLRHHLSGSLTLVIQQEIDD